MSSSSEPSPTSAASAPFLFNDDPFNLKAKKAPHPLSSDDVPIPRTRAAAAALLLEGSAEDATPASAATALSLSFPTALSFTYGDESDKENMPKPEAEVERKAPLKRRPLVRRRSADGTAASASAASPSNAGHDREHSRTLSGVFPPKQPSSSSSSARAPKRKKPHTAAAADPSSKSGCEEVAFTGELSVSDAWEQVKDDIGEEMRTALSSKKWTEVVQAIAEIRTRMERAEAGAQSREGRLRAALWLLADAPGFAVNNVAVMKALCEACEALLSSITVAPAFVRAALPPLLGRTSERKSLSIATPLLVALSAACSPRVVQAVIAGFLPSCKNVRVLEAVFALLSSLTAHFGLSAMSLPALLALARGHCEDPQQQVRTSAVALLQAVYQQTGPSFRDHLLSLVSASTAPALTAALHAVEEVGQRWGGVPDLRARGEGAELVPVTLDAVFPRVELSARLGEDVYAKLRDPNWRHRQQGLEETMAALRALHLRVILRDCTLLTLLAPLLLDSNKAIQHLALGLLSALLHAVPEALPRHREKLLPPLVQALADAKKAVKDEAARVLEQWIAALGLSGLMKWAVRGLEGAGRRELLEVLVKWREAEGDWQEVIPALLDGLCDRSGEVRAMSERLVEAIIERGGGHAVSSAVQRLKAAYQLQVAPVVERCKQGKKDKDRERAQPPSHDVPPLNDQPREARSVSTSSAASAPADDDRRAKKTASLKKKAELASARQQRDEEQRDAELLSLTPVDATSHPFLVKPDLAAKQRRLLKDGKRLQSTHFRDWSAEEREDFSAALAGLVSSSMHAAMFSAEFSRVLIAVEFFSEQLRASPHSVHCIADVLLKWASALFTEANPKLLLALLALVNALLASFAASSLRFSDAEMMNVLPFLVERVAGHTVSKVRKDAAAVLLALPRDGLFPAHKTVAYVVSGLDSKNKRVVSESCDCIGQLWAMEAQGRAGERRELSAGMWNEVKKALPALALLLSTGDPAVRLSALGAIVSAYHVIGEQLWAVLAREGGRPTIPEKVLSMIEERLKRIKLDAMPLHTALSSAPPAPSTAVVNTPVKSAGPVQRTPLSKASQIPRTPIANASGAAALGSPQSTGSAGTAGRSRRHGRTPSKIPTLSSLSSSLASLEAMQASLTNAQYSAVAARAAPLQLPSLLMAMQGGADDEQLRSAQSLAAFTAQHGCEPLLQHVPLIARCIVRVLQRGTSSAVVADGAPMRRDEGRREVVAALRALLAYPAVVDGFHSDSAQEVVDALLRFTAQQMHCRGDHVGLKGNALACVHALMDAQPVMTHFSIFSSLLLSAIVAPSEPASTSPLCALLQPLLLRWTTLASAPTIDLPLLLSSMHRMFLELPTTPSPLLSSLHSVLTAVVGRCSSAKVRELMRGFAVDAPIVGLLRAILGEEETKEQTDERSRREPPSAQSERVRERPPQRKLLGRKSRQLYAAVVHEPQGETVEEAKDNGTGKAVSLDELMLQPSSAPSPAPHSSLRQPPTPSSVHALPVKSMVELEGAHYAAVSGAAAPPPSPAPAASAAASYLERFQHLQQQLRVATPTPLQRLVHVGPSVSPPLSPVRPPSAPPSFSPLRGSPVRAPLSSGATSSVSAVVHDSLSAASLLSRSSAFEALRTRMKAREPANGEAASAMHALTRALSPARSYSQQQQQQQQHPASLSSLLHTPSTAAPSMTPAGASSSALSSVSSVGALLATPAPLSAPSLAGLAASASSSRPPLSFSYLADGMASSGIPSGNNAVSALRARLASINAANRRAAGA